MSNLAIDDFPEFFRDVNEGKEPFPWQSRLAAQVCETGCWPTCLDLPTGTGKTAVLEVAVFHLALEAQLGTERKAPVRMAFVVDRRLIVDQTETRALAIQARIEMADDSVASRVGDRLRELAAFGKKPLRVEKLRGGVPRTNDWARTPSQPTVLLSTVDQVGSRLLFRGYGVSDSMKPVHAGLLGSDCLIFLDEAHLSEPFRQTLGWVSRYRKPPWCEQQPGPWQVVTLSATPTGSDVDPFRLAEADREHPVLRARLMANKPTQLAEASGPTAFADQAIAFAKAGAKRVLVVVNRVDLARSVFELLGKEEKRLLIGRSREWDRAQIVKHFAETIISGAPPRETPLFIVATQCIEAGADFDFDALVTQIAPLDALRQRFGRLNRMGRPIEARAAILALKTDLKSKTPDPVYGEQSKKTWDFLQTDGDQEIDFGVDPMATRLADAGFEKVREVSSIKGDAPVIPPAYIDLWSLTCPVPDPDPEVSLFLHGPKSGPADVEIIWRADLGTLGRDRSEALREIVGALPPRPSESLGMPIWKVRDWLANDAEEAGRVGEIEGEGVGELSRDGRPSGFVFRWRGEEDERSRVIAAEEIRPGDVILVPSTYGGCDEWGWAPKSTTYVRDWAAEAAKPFWRQRITSRFHSALLTESLHASALRLAVESEKPEELRDQLTNLESLPVEWKAELDAMRRVTEKRDYDDGSGFILIGRAKSPVFQSESDASSVFGAQALLCNHTQAVLGWTSRFARAAALSSAGIHSAELAAELHDTGKGDRRFQAYLRNGPAIPDETLAKSIRGSLAPAIERRFREAASLPDGWRHEALSVRVALQDSRLASLGLDPELVLWLIGTHHGRGRPFFDFTDPLEGLERMIDSPDGPLSLGAAAGPQSHDFDWNGLDWPGLFARLRLRYGPWELARREAILRLADHRASEAEGSDGK